MNHTLHTGRLTVGDLRGVLGDTTIPDSTEVIVIQASLPRRWVGEVMRDSLKGEPPYLVLRLGGHVDP